MKKKKARVQEGVKNELRLLLLVLLFLALGGFLAWAADTVINDKEPPTVGDPLLVSLLVMPILIYTIISGTLQELKGPGGLEATFRSVATKSVSETIEHTPVSVEKGGQVLTKAGRYALEKQVNDLRETRPAMMSVTFGGGHYTLNTLKEYVEVLSRSRTYKLLVFLDAKDQFVAHMPLWVAKNILRARDKGEEFVEIINKGQSRDLFAVPGVVRKLISANCTNAEALREMTVNNTDALVVTDENQRMQGITERGQVLSRMVLALSE